jgi:glycosyltransferase involved in cell wall biosynthesis
MSGPVRALQVVDALGMGGAETWLMAVLRHWTASGAGRFDFLLTGGVPAVFDDEARALGARTFYLPYRRGALPSFRRGFRRILRDGAYDAIHDHQDYASGWHFLLGGSALPPVRVTHVHNPAYQIRHNYGISPARRVTAAIGKRLVARHATAVRGTSRQVLREYGFDEGEPLYCGIETARFAGEAAGARARVRAEFGWPGDARVVLVAGRIDRSADPSDPRTHKHTAFAVAAGIAAMRRDARVCMLFAGERSAAVPELERRVAAAGLAPRVAFAGVRHDVPALMRASDVLLFPSRGEGLGLVAVEAQAAGLPVLASAAVPREAVVVPALVTVADVAEGDQAWAARLMALAGAPPPVPPARANALVAASPFDLAQSAAALERLYRGSAGA